jgi:diacylglycerol kinase family enzyme
MKKIDSKVFVGNVGERNMASRLRYSIIANPAAGTLPSDRRYALLKQAAAVLRAGIHGLDTGSTAELVQCAREQAARCDVLVVAGGDGTMSAVINAVDLASTALAFLPFGTGNALTHALGYRGGPLEIALRIRSGALRACDLIDCDGRKKAFMASLGVDGAAIRRYERYRSRGCRGLTAHLRAGLGALLGEYRPAGGRIDVDGDIRQVWRLMSLMVVKQPFFGMGLKAVPRARWDDGKLHSLTLAAGLPRALAGLVTGFTVGNRVGDYRCGKRLTARLTRPLTIQVDGELGWTSDRFAFAVLPRAFRLKC